MSQRVFSHKEYKLHSFIKDYQMVTDVNASLYNWNSLEKNIARMKDLAAKNNIKYVYCFNQTIELAKNHSTNQRNIDKFKVCTKS